MRQKDYIVKAIDDLADAMRMIVRIDENNAKQTRRNLDSAGEKIAEALDAINTAKG